jgi:glutathione S-transferase
MAEGMMAREARFVLHHAPRSRADRALWMLEEARADYAIVPHDLERRTQKEPGFLALNPLGKLPVLEDRGPEGSWRGVAVAESAGILAYLADTLPEAALAPAIGTPERAAYARWMAYGPSVLEPAFCDAAFPRAAEVPSSALGWPSFEEALAPVEATLASGGPWLLGARFSAADVLIGSFLQWLRAWGRLQAGPQVERYLGALEGRDALARARARGQA